MTGSPFPDGALGDDCVPMRSPATTQYRTYVLLLESTESRRDCQGVTIWNRLVPQGRFPDPTQAISCSHSRRGGPRQGVRRARREPHRSFDDRLAGLLHYGYSRSAREARHGRATPRQSDRRRVVATITQDGVAQIERIKEQKLDQLELLLTDSSIDDPTICLHVFRTIEHQIHELVER